MGGESQRGLWILPVPLTSEDLGLLNQRERFRYLVR